MGLRVLVATVLSVFFSAYSYSQSLSFSGEEVSYDYEASFRSLSTQVVDDSQVISSARFHADHLFGLFHSPEMAERYGYPAELIEGFAGTKNPKIIFAQSFRREGDPYLWVHYRAQGKMIVLKQVLKAWLKDHDQGTVELPLLQDLPAIYADDLQSYRRSNLRSCTDPQDPSVSSFSYFYNPFRCPELGEAPIAKMTPFWIQRELPLVKGEPVFPSREILGDNQNGALTVLYFIEGLEQVKDKNWNRQKLYRDYGWKSFRFLEKLLVSKFGFTQMSSLDEFRTILQNDFNQISLETPVTLMHYDQLRFFNTFVKKVGSQIFVVRVGLLNTDNESKPSPLRSFPKFWKEAWENGDLIYFSGHSGDGQTLNLKTFMDHLESFELDEINFMPDKTQVVILDSCSSYALYQDAYSAQKSKNLHLVTFGLVSLFHLVTATMEQVVQTVLNASNPTWLEALESIERKQLDSHVAFSFEKEDQPAAMKEYVQQKACPSALINVLVQ